MEFEKKTLKKIRDMKKEWSKQGIPVIDVGEPQQDCTCNHSRANHTCGKRSAESSMLFLHHEETAC